MVSLFINTKISQTNSTSHKQCGHVPCRQLAPRKKKEEDSKLSPFFPKFTRQTRDLSWGRGSERVERGQGCCASWTPYTWKEIDMRKKCYASQVNPASISALYPVSHVPIPLANCCLLPRGRTLEHTRDSSMSCHVLYPLSGPIWLLGHHQLYQSHFPQLQN